MKKKKVAKQTEPGGHPKRIPFRPLPPKTWKIKRMPRDLKEQLDNLLSEGTMHTSLQLAKWLTANGVEISNRCIDDYRHNFERHLDSVRLATAPARLLCEQFKGEDEEQPSARMMLRDTPLL